MGNKLSLPVPRNVFGLLRFEWDTFCLRRSAGILKTDLDKAYTYLAHVCSKLTALRVECKAQQSRLLDLPRQVEVDNAEKYALSLASASELAAFEAAFCLCTFVAGEGGTLTGVVSDL